MSFALSKFDHHFSRSFITKLVRRTVVLFALGLFFLGFRWCVQEWNSLFRIYVF